MPRLLWIGNPFFSAELVPCGWETAFHNFEDPLAYGWDDLVRLAGFVPDVVVVADKSLPPFVLGMEDFPCLTVFYSVDSHIHSWHPFYAQGFDACLVSLRDHVSRFAGTFLPEERVWWSPAFAWTHDAPVPDVARDRDCVFVGSMSAEMPRRRDFLTRLGKRLPGLCVTHGAYRELYSRACVVLNHCEHGDLNFRVFEALGCGACLVTPRIGHGLTDLFTEGRHMLCYAPDTSDEAVDEPVARAMTGASVREAEEHIRFLLANPEKAQNLRQEALSVINASHRAIHRAQSFTRHMEALLQNASAITARRRSQASAIRTSCLRLLYLHWAEMTDNAMLRMAYLKAAH
ncbi:MAG: glycosyltransferase family 1 protein [Desulfovibrio sp.]|nr:glycosyltransferase family 1 protein [Desulfovibrio sp.]